MSLLGIAAGGAIQAGLGVLNNIWADNRQKEYMGLNYGYNELAASNADQRTRNLYKDFYSPEALMKQYRAAGLSPSMMFGGTPGQGGLSGAQGNGAAGQSAPYMPISMLEGAQIAAINAQTEKTKAETKTIEAEREPTVENLFADLNKKFAETNNTKAQTTLTKLQASYQEITNKWADPNYEINYKVAAAQTEVLSNQTTLLIYQALHEKTESELAELTKEARAEQVNLQNRNLIKDLLLKGEQIHFTETQTDVLVKDIENKTILMRAQYNNFVADNVLKYSQAEFMERNKKFFDDQMDMWLSDFKKDFYKFGESMGLERDKLDLEYKKLEETIRHNQMTEIGLGLFGTLKSVSGW